MDDSGVEFTQHSGKISESSLQMSGYVQGK